MENVLGANVPGCCFEGSNLCGVLDVTGIIGQAAGADANNCVLRANVTLTSLSPLSCDGSPVDDAPSGGAGGSASAGTGDSATAGAAGASTTGGSGAASTDVECPDDTICAENELIATQMTGFRFCGSDEGRFGHTPPAGSSQEDCDDGPGGNYQDIAGLIEGCFIICE